MKILVFNFFLILLAMFISWMLLEQDVKLIPLWLIILGALIKSWFPKKEQKKPVSSISVAVEEQAEAREVCDQAYDEEQMQYIPPEFVGCLGNDSKILYHFYLIELQPDFDSHIVPHDILLATRTRLEFDNETLKFELNVDRGSLKIVIKYVRHVKLTSEEVLVCQKFQVTLFRLLLDHNQNKLHEALSGSIQNREHDVFDYLLIPSTGSREDPSVDWKCVNSVLFRNDKISNKHTDYSSNRDHDFYFHTKDGLVCSCTLENCLVVTPHNGKIYCITGVLKDMNSNSLLHRRKGGSLTYKENFAKHYGIELCFEEESLLRGKHLFIVQNCLLGNRKQKTKGSRKSSVELPPELCEVIMSPISIASILSFSYAPSIIHWLESFLIAGNLKRMLKDHNRQNDMIPTIKVLEAITTKNCQENFHLTSLATLGDSFLKYAASQKLFKTHQNYDRGLLTEERIKIISNPALCKLGYEKKIPGFIRNECFDPETWIIPGDKSRTYRLEKVLLSPRSIIYGWKKRKIEIKTVADVIEALIGAFLCTVGEQAALAFMEWVGIKVDFGDVPYQRTLPTNAEKLVDLKYFESLLNKYSFHDVSLLVEALTHGSYKRPESPRSYKRLEFLGDAVLDYLITMHFYNEYPNLSSGLLTDLRSAQVNNDFYARTTIKVGLHKHILYDSQVLGRRIDTAVKNFEQSRHILTFGWESEEVIKVLADIIESLAGAIYVDSGYDKEAVFRSIKPLLEPLVTPETIKLHPVRELKELCAREHYVLKDPEITYDNGETSITLEVNANGTIYTCQRSAANRETAEKSAAIAMLEKLKIT